MASGYDFDLFVIGGGSGGVRAARVAARHGARVGIAEEHRYGGTCVIRGCVPKKLLVYASQFSDQFADAEGFGWSSVAPEHDWPRLIARKDAEIDRLNGIYERLLQDAGVQVFHGRATFADAHRLAVEDRFVTAEHILVATGASPFLPDVPGIEHAITSNEAFHLPSLGERIIVVGGGYVAVEFAGIFRGLGRQVTMVVRSDNILRGFDEDARDLVASEMHARGIAIDVTTEVNEIEQAGTFLHVHLSSGETMSAEHVMYATGRPPNTAGLGLPEIGVALGRRGEVPVDAYSRTAVPHIYAVGDCTDRHALTPVAIAEGQAFADTVFGGRPTPVEHEVIPTAVFGQPACAAVGLTESEARKRHAEVAVYESRFRPMKATLSGRDTRTLAKVIVDVASDRVLGIHMGGEEAPEIIQALAVAMQMGVKKRDLDRTLALHPSAAEEFVLMRTRRPDPQ